MAVDAWEVIASGRRRGLPDAVIARQLGLKDGQQAYGIMRQDAERKPVIIVPGAPTPAIRVAPRSESIATPAPAAIITCKAETAPVITEIEQDAGVRTKAQTAAKISHILAAVAEAFDVTEVEMVGPSQKRDICRARFAAYRLLSKRAGLSTTRIGYTMGCRDHTSAIHGIRKTEELMFNNPPWRARYDAAELLLIARQPEQSAK